MNFNKENIRHIKELIVFTLVLLIALWNYDLVLGAFGFVGNIVFPFLVGGAIAFVLNVPMSFLERNLFGNEKVQSKKRLKRMSRPFSLVLTIVGVLGIIAVVTFVVIPQLDRRLSALDGIFSVSSRKAMLWLEDCLKINQEILALISEMDMSRDTDRSIVFCSFSKRCRKCI